MNQEELFARQVCRVLDRETQNLDHEIVERLRAARERALQRQRVLVPKTVLVGADGTALMDGNEGRHPLRIWLAMLALLIGVGLAYVWNGYNQASENEEIDSALLADDLPPHAYLDKGFQAWLEQDSASGD
ncbi:DUF3619 family protein [Sulfuricystis multivorans]|uniref:DUF3619 family protein n=1 Tax=Sulfuricystis multivorans TaxID=2211108 RepID=UPI001558C855|nr:DUF3619 family protein [Sulfuricystis multivorans]